MRCPVIVMLLTCVCTLPQEAAQGAADSSGSSSASGSGNSSADGSSAADGSGHSGSSAAAADSAERRKCSSCGGRLGLKLRCNLLCNHTHDDSCKEMPTNPSQGCRPCSHVNEGPACDLSRREKAYGPLQLRASDSLSAATAAAAPSSAGAITRIASMRDCKHLLNAYSHPVTCVATAAGTAASSDAAALLQVRLRADSALQHTHGFASTAVSYCYPAAVAAPSSAAVAIRTAAMRGRWTLNWAATTPAPHRNYLRQV